MIWKHRTQHIFQNVIIYIVIMCKFIMIYHIMCWLVILHCFGGFIHYVIILTSVVTSFWVGPRLIATSLDFFTLFWNLWIMLQLLLRLKTDCEISTPHNHSFSIALKSLITQQTHNPTCVDLHLFVVAAVSLCLHSFSCWKCKPKQVLKTCRPQ